MPNAPVTLGPGQGESFPILGGSIRILVDGASSNGQSVSFENVTTAGDGPPLHRHEREDELFYVLSGRFKFAIDGQTFIAEPGAFVYAPRGSIHTFRNVAREDGTMLVTCTPAGIENVFRATQLPKPGSGREPLSMDEMIARFTAHGITFHGPPLNAS